MTDRQFLTDDELDRLLDAMPGRDDVPVATMDQVDAAARDMTEAGHTMAMACIAEGGWALIGGAPRDAEVRHRMVRSRLKMMLAAFSADVSRLCPHTREIRPLLLTCDPPALVCMQQACLERLQRNRPPFRWDNHCDGCGRHTPTVTPHIAGFGPLTISGHLCRSCADDMATTALEAAEEVEVVSRKSPCPCGSGRRYKRCHGSNH